MDRSREPAASVHGAIAEALSAVEAEIERIPQADRISRRARALAILRTKLEEVAALAQYHGIG